MENSPETKPRKGHNDGQSNNEKHTKRRRKFEIVFEPGEEYSEGTKKQKR